MTALAYRDGVFAADSMAHSNGLYIGTCRKIGRSPNGTLGGAAGYSAICDRFLALIDSGAVDVWLSDPLSSSLETGAKADRDFYALIVTRDGKVFGLDERGFPHRWDALFYAEGSAEHLLIGAMAAGASAEEAVGIAIKYDSRCAGPIQVMRLKE